MIAIELNKKEAETVLRERFAHPYPKVQRRMEVIHLLSLGKSYAEIEEIVGCSHASVARWLRIYRSSGLEGLKVDNAMFFL